MFISAILLAAVAPPPVPPPAVPPPIEQHVADCGNPVYASDQLTCSDEALLELDGELASLLPLAMPIDGLAVEDQSDWFRRSRMCALRSDHRACLIAAYRERIAVARSLSDLDVPALSWQSMNCRKRAKVEIAALPGDMIAVRHEGQVWIALRAINTETWLPYSWATQKERNFEIHGPADVTVRCGVVRRIAP